MTCSSSWPLNFYDFPFFKASIAKEPELERVEDSLIFAGICRMDRGSRQQADDGCYHFILNLRQCYLGWT